MGFFIGLMPFFFVVSFSLFFFDNDHCLRFLFLGEGLRKLFHDRKKKVKGGESARNRCTDFFL